MKLPLFIDEKPFKNYRKLIGSAMSFTPLSWFHGVNDTAELISRCQGTHWADFTVPRTPLSWFHGAKDTTELISRGVKDPTELISPCPGPHWADFTVSRTPLSLTPRCQWYHWADFTVSRTPLSWFHGVNNPTEFLHMWISQLYQNLSIWIRGSEGLGLLKNLLTCS